MAQSRTHASRSHGLAQQRAESPADANSPSSLLRGLMDLRFKRFLTTEMVPAIYGFGIFIAALWTVFVVVWAFGHSQMLGVAWLLLLGPAMFLAIVVTIRVMLEFVLALFRVSAMVENVDAKVDHIVGQTEEIHDDIPRIRFWKQKKDSSR